MFAPGSIHTARVVFTDTKGIAKDYTAQLFVGPSESSVTFHLDASGSTPVDFPITMPAIAGEYTPQVTVYVGEEIAAIRAYDPITVLEPATNLFGVVRDTDGNPIEGAGVQVLSPDYSDMWVVYNTPSNGAYSIEGIKRINSPAPGNDYWVIAAKSGYVPYQEFLDLPFGDVEMNFQLATKYLTVTDISIKQEHVYAGHPVTVFITLSNPYSGPISIDLDDLPVEIDVAHIPYWYRDYWEYGGA